ncbi:MAG TPA: collagen-binding domain-containing protein, partial [Polyangia bacterium]
MKSATLALAPALALGFGCGTATTNEGTGGALDPGAPTRAANPGLCAPPTAFSFALCTCEDLTQVGLLKVGRGGSGDGSVGVNGSSAVANASDVSGSWVTWKDWSAATGAHIGGSLRSGANLKAAGALWVGKDLAVKQNLTGAGLLTVGGDLRVGGTDLFLGARQIAGGRGAFDSPAAPPCGCDPQTLFDVAGAVAQAGSKNDNAAHAISSGTDLSIGVQRLVLDTGRYYFKGVHNIGAGVLDIRGNVAIYLDGSLDEIGAQAIKLESGATLDLYVSGAVRLIGFSPLGNRQSPSSFRLFIGGSDRVSVGAGLQEFFGSIYAPTADLAFAGVTVVWGSLFAKQVVDAGVLTINHGGAIPTCTPPVNVPPSTG